METSLSTSVLAAAADGGAFSFFYTATAAEFLSGYLLWFVFLFVGSRAIQKGKADDHPLPTFAGLFLFESVGLLRIVIGSSHGMHKWDFLIVMMILGGVMFFSRFEKTGGSSGSSSGCSSGGAAAEAVAAVEAEVVEAAEDDWRWLSS